MTLLARVRSGLRNWAHSRPNQYLSYFEDVETLRNGRLARYAFICVAVILVCLAHHYFVMPDMFVPVAIGCLCTAPLLLIAGMLAAGSIRPFVVADAEGA